MATEWTHKGVTITLNERGEFRARIAASNKTFGSLDSAKKAIDKAEGFESFKALRRPDWMDKKESERPFAECEVVGIEKPRGKTSFRNHPNWRLADGRLLKDVWADTPENRAALTARAELMERHAAEESKRRKEAEEATERIKVLRPPM